MITLYYVKTAQKLHHFGCETNFQNYCSFVLCEGIGLVLISTMGLFSFKGGMAYFGYQRFVSRV